MEISSSTGPPCRIGRIFYSRAGVLADVTPVGKSSPELRPNTRDQVVTPSNRHRLVLTRLRRRIAVAIVAGVIGLTDVGDVFVEQAVAGKQDSGGTVSAYGKKVRR
jgi:hypothetical protein